MAYVRQLNSHFDPVYIKPANLRRLASEWRLTATPAYAQDQQQWPARREQDRRCGIDRRTRQVPTLLDTRSPHARRKQSSRRDWDGQGTAVVTAGIDVYA